MKSNAASLTKAQKDKQEAGRYRWHLEPPIVKRFDHSHWWEETPDKPVEALVWEIFRRHPDTYAYFVRHRKWLTRQAKLTEVLGATSDFGTDLAAGRIFQTKKRAFLANTDRLFLAAHCFDSWPKLSIPTQRMWRKFFHENVKPQRGCHPSAVIVLNEHRKSAIQKSNRAKWNLEENAKFLRYSATLALRQPDEFLYDCEQHDRDGRIVISINPTASLYRIRAAMEAAVQAWPGRVEMQDTERSRLDNCLNVIAVFEKNEMKATQVAGSQPFTKYYRIIREWFKPS